MFGLDGSVRFWFAGEFLENFLAWRLLGIEGRLGAGKTLLSLALARWLYDHGFVEGIFANLPVNPDFIPVREQVRGSVVVVDEAWFCAVDARHTSTSFKGYGAFFRKLDAFLISPGVWSTDKRSRPLFCEKDSELWMLGMWTFRWENKRGDKGTFGVTGVESVFEGYPHEYIPPDDWGILDQIYKEIKEVSGGTSRMTWEEWLDRRKG